MDETELARLRTMLLPLVLPVGVFRDSNFTTTLCNSSSYSLIYLHLTPVQLTSYDIVSLI